MADGVGWRLFEAIQNGDTDRVRDILRNDHAEVMTLTHSDAFSEFHFLHEACRRGHEEIVTLLTGYYHSLDMVNSEGTALKVACEHGFLHIVDVLLSSGATLPEPVTGDSNCPFFTAAFHGWVGVIDHLFRFKPDMFFNYSHQVAVLQAACYGGQLNVVRYCLDRIKSLTSGRLSASFLSQFLDAACQVKHIGIIRHLISMGACLTDDVISSYPDTIRKALEEGVKILYADDTEEETSSKKIGKVCISWHQMRLQAVDPSWFSPHCTHLTELDLSANALHHLPDIVPWSLTHLIKFGVASNQLVSLPLPPDGVVNCQGLLEFDVSHNQLTHIPMDIFQLTHLKNLNLSHNKLVSLSLSCDEADDSDKLAQLNSDSPLSTKWYASTPNHDDYDQVSWRCKHLHILDVSHNHLRSLPPEICACSELTHLRACNNQLTSFMAPWSCPLVELNLSSNAIVMLPCCLDDYWSGTLQRLLVSHNLLQHITQSVCRLGALKELNMSHNKLCCLPDATWWECHELDTLNLSHNRLHSNTSGSGQKRGWRSESSLTKWLSVRRRYSDSYSTQTQNPLGATHTELPLIFADWLTDLDLSHNDLGSVPAFVCQLKILQRLNLSHNPRLQYLPLELGLLVDLYDIRLDDLNLKHLPQQLYTNNGLRSKDVLAHLKVELRRSEPYNKLKLMIVGKESKGKTTLVEALQGRPPPPNLATNGIAISQWTVSGQLMRQKNHSQRHDVCPDVTFQVWDFAGQSDYYVTHKVFLSPAALYLLVYDLRLHKEGVAGLKQWLLDIQAHAPNSHIIIVGTFLDQLSAIGRNQITVLHDEIWHSYGSAFPAICQMTEVSGLTGEGVADLVNMVCEAAMSIECRRGSTTGLANVREKMIGRKVPRSYLDLEVAVMKEADRRRHSNELPVMTHGEFYALLQTIPMNDIRTTEEITLATQFLVESGTILHYNDPLHGLDQLYFVDPSWLAELLAKFICIDSVNRCVRNGILPMAKAHSVLFANDPFQKVQLKQYIQLLEKFEVALQLNQHHLLIPSKLPEQRPCIQMGQTGILRRLYKLAYTPSGFWSRLITRLLVMVQRLNNDEGDEDNKGILQDKLWNTFAGVSSPQILYWQQGIYVNYENSSFCVESVAHFSDYADHLSVHSDHFSGHSEVSSSDHLTNSPLEGALVTVHCCKQNFAMVGFVADQIDSLIDEWYPGLEAVMDYSRPVTQRLVPCPSCSSLHHHHHDDILHTHLHSVQQCVTAALNQCSIRCPRCHSNLQPKHLIPDLLFSDLPKRFRVEPSELIFSADVLGHGGEGSVYRGWLRGEMVAVKQHHAYRCRNSMHSATHSKSGQDVEKESQPIGDDSNSGSQIFTEEEEEDHLCYFNQDMLLKAFQLLRQEVCLLSRLRHPCLVSLLAVDVTRLCFVLQYAPLGSLRSVLDEQLHKNLPGGATADSWRPAVLGRMLTYKFTVQIGEAIRYLHAQRITYKDLKCDNILVWSLDENASSNVKISDYGLSRYCTPQGVTGNEGTPGYQAPEMMSHAPYDEKVDIFAFGMVMNEMITGFMPFSKVTSPGILIQKCIEQGKRPSLKEHHIELEMPLMERLMEQCWQHDPCDRPSAAEVITRLCDASVFCHLNCLPSPEQGTISKVTATWANSAIPEARQGYLRMWTGESDDRSYHVLNVQQGHFKVRDERHRGAKVTCMTMIGSMLLLGNVNKELECLRHNRLQGRLAAVSSPVKTPDVPLAIISHRLKVNASETHTRVYVSLANGQLCAYTMTSEPCLSSEQPATDVSIRQCQTVTLCASGFPAKCMAFVGDNSEELWVGCGGEVVVMDAATLDVIQHLRAYSARAVEIAWVSNIVCHGDQIWCSSHKSCKVVEFDADSKQRVCVIDCGSSEGVGSVIVEFARHARRAASPAPDITPALVSTPEPDQSHTLLASTANIAVQTSTAKKTDIFAKLRRKLTMRPATKTGMLRRREKSPMAASASTVRKGQWASLVSSACYVDGTLWLGRRCGDVLVVNVSQHNPFDRPYGQVVAILCSGYLPGYGNGRVDQLIPVGADRVASLRVITYDQASHDSCRIDVWKAYGLDGIHKLHLMTLFPVTDDTDNDDDDDDNVTSFDTDILPPDK